MPVIRPLWVEFPKDVQTFSIEDQFLLAPSLLVKPVTKPSQRTLTVYFPQNSVWYETVTGEMYGGGMEINNINAPLERLPVFQRGGSIIPRRERMRRSSQLTHNDPFTLVITLDPHGSSDGWLYLDDGHSLSFRDGAFILRRFHMSPSSPSSPSSSSSGSSGSWVITSSTPISRSPSSLFFFTTNLLNIINNRAYYNIRFIHPNQINNIKLLNIFIILIVIHSAFQSSPTNHSQARLVGLS